MRSWQQGPAFAVVFSWEQPSSPLFVHQPISAPQRYASRAARVHTPKRSDHKRVGLATPCVLQPTFPLPSPHLPFFLVQRQGRAFSYRASVSYYVLALAIAVSVSSQSFPLVFVYAMQLTIPFAVLLATIVALYSAPSEVEAAPMALVRAPNGRVTMPLRRVVRKSDAHPQVVSSDAFPIIYNHSSI